LAPSWSCRWALGVLLLAGACGTKAPQPAVPPPPTADAGDIAAPPHIDAAESSPPPPGPDAADSARGVSSDAAVDLGPLVPTSGQVLDFTSLLPLAGRSVSIGAATPVTDDSGRFVLGRAPGLYHVRIAEPDGASISFYRGLGRNDPVLLHHRAGSSRRLGEISGNVSGVGSFPLTGKGRVDIYFFSDRISNSIGIGASAVSPGPAFGPMRLSWDGPQAVTGRLIALGRFDGVEPVGFADQPLTVSDRGAATASVMLSPVASTGHLGGIVGVPTGYVVSGTGAFYRLPIGDAAVTLAFDDGVKTTFDHVVPSLPALGGQLCVSASASPDFTVTHRCGLSLGQQNVDVNLQASPTLTVSSTGTLMTPDTAFSWTPFENGIHMLGITPQDGPDNTPEVHLFTAETATTWRALATMGVTFSTTVKCKVSVAGLGPYRTMDQATSIDGIGSVRPLELRRAYSSNRFLQIGP
jgi:hypothetical protein